MDLIATMLECPEEQSRLLVQAVSDTMKSIWRLNVIVCCLLFLCFGQICSVLNHAAQVFLPIILLRITQPLGRYILYCLYLTLVAILWLSLFLYAGLDFVYNLLVHIL